MFDVADIIICKVTMTVLSQCEYKLVEIVQETFVCGLTSIVWTDRVSLHIQGLPEITSNISFTTVVPLLYVHSVIKLSFLP